MSDSGFGPNSKAGTVYSGPTPVGTTGTIYGGPTPPPPSAGGTVYNGSAAGGTVYSGPSGAGTVYNGASIGATAPRPGLGNVAVNAGAKKGARVFYVLAAFTALRTVLLFFGVQQLTLGANRAVADSLQLVVVVNLVVVGILVLLGIFTGNGSKIALLIGMVLYGVDTALLLINPGPNVVYIIVHGIFLYYLFDAYRQFAD
jgi:hypothetical protein